ncbi:hypothetical protein N9U75_02840 [Pelagibacteraceae bacterium]|nr:hypothetical protein [Pelagibacteraceae bacterium]
MSIRQNIKIYQILSISLIILFNIGNHAFSKEICSWIINDAYPEILQENPNNHFYVVVGKDGRCEYGTGDSIESAINECKKWKKENNINGICKPFAIGSEIVWEGEINKKTTGCIEGECKNGLGTYVWEDGTTYEGEWRNGEMYRDGIGCIAGNCENGYGTVVWDDGDKYIGKFKNGALHGEGELTFAENGEKWIGTWKNGKLQGKGEIIAWDGSTRVCKFDGYKCAKLIKEIKNFILKESLWTNNKIMTKDDVSSFKTLKFVEEKEVMEFDKRTSKNKNQYGTGIEMKVFDAFIFNASFEKSQDILIKVNAEFKTQEKAEKQALKWAKMYGQMPYFLKQNVRYIVVHKGDVGWAGGNGKIVIHIHSAKSSFNEELMFHELSHASLDFKWSTGVIDEDEWKKAIGEDKYYISEYAWDLFYEEDIAETTLWWFAIRCKPSNISKKNYDKIIKHLPNRFNYLDKQNFDFYPVKCE